MPTVHAYHHVSVHASLSHHCCHATIYCHAHCPCLPPCLCSCFTVAPLLSCHYLLSCPLSMPTTMSLFMLHCRTTAVMPLFTVMPTVHAYHHVSVHASLSHHCCHATIYCHA